MEQNLCVIARIESDFSTKFGIPRQSGLVNDNVSFIVFEPSFRDENALRGLEDFSHIWLIWGFSEVKFDSWLPMVKPPRLGGNKRMGVFATRSPYRPNRLGLSSVQLLGIEKQPGRGLVLKICGADLMHGTPIYDIKPYLPFTDSHPHAKAGFAAERFEYSLKVDFPPHLLNCFPSDKHEALLGILSQDPRPAYKGESNGRFGFEFAGFDVRFVVENGTAHVVEVERLTK